MWNMTFLVTGAIFIALLLIVFFSKDVIDSEENKFFKWLILINMIAYMIEIPLQLFVRNFGVDFVLVDIFSRLYVIATFTWFSFFSIYTFVICLDDNEKNKFSLIKNINLIVWIIGFILLVFLPFEKFHEGEKMYIYGSEVDILRIFLAAYMLLWIGLLLKNIKNVREKKYVPIFLIIILLLVNVFINSIDPSILISSMIGVHLFAI